MVGAESLAVGGVPGADVLVFGDGEEEVAVAVVFDLGQGTFLQVLSVNATTVSSWRAGGAHTWPCNRVGLIVEVVLRFGAVGCGLGYVRSTLR
jgi:hypothetical protein